MCPRAGIQYQERPLPRFEAECLGYRGAALHPPILEEVSGQHRPAGEWGSTPSPVHAVWAPQKGCAAGQGVPDCPFCLHGRFMSLTVPTRSVSRRQGRYEWSSEGWLWGPGVRSVWHRLFGMRGKQSCSQLWGSTAGGPCCPQSSVGRLKISVSAGRDTPWPSSSP